MMPTLLNIAADFSALDSLLEELGGDISDPAVEQAIADWEAELGANLDAKVDGYCAYVRELELRAAARKEEEERIAKGRKTCEARAAWLKRRLIEAMTAIGVKKAGRVRTASIAANGGALPLVFEVDPEPGDVPDYERTIIELDHAKIRKALEDGVVLDWVRLGERGKHLRIT